MTSKNIHICGFKTENPPYTINTTSRSKMEWSRALSPFFLGPVRVPGNGLTIAQNVENGWQYSKCYKDQWDEESQQPLADWYEWRNTGFDKKSADRYPKGKGVKPVCSWTSLDGKLGYIQARKRLYIPMYADCVVKTDAYQALKRIYKKYGEIYLWDFDAYDHHALGMSWQDVIECETKTMGHAFVLGMLLDGFL